VLHVVAFDETRAVAAGEAAAAVAGAQDALQRKRDAPGLASDVQRFTVISFDDADDGAVAAEPANGVERELGAVVELATVRFGAGRGPIRSERCLTLSIG